MWNDRITELQLRRALLLARSAALRERMAGEAQPLKRTLARADLVGDQLRWCAAHPWWIAAALAVPVALRPGRALALALKLWSGWRLWRRVRLLLPR